MLLVGFIYYIMLMYKDKRNYNIVTELVEGLNSDDEK